MSYEATAPAKLVLMGEYAVLEGAPAVVCAVDRSVRVTLDPLGGARWEFASELPDHPVTVLHWSEGEGRAEVEAGANDEWAVLPGTVLACVAEQSNVDVEEIPACRVRIESLDLYADDGRSKLGLGSSAAIVVALAAGLRSHMHAEGLLTESVAREDALLFDLATHGEVQQAGGSGVDVAASTFGGVLAYQVDEETVRVEPTELPRDIAFQAVWAGTPASTPRFLEGIDTWAKAEPDAFAARMEEMTSIAVRALEACRANDGEMWMSSIEDQLRALEALGEAAGLPIVSDAHRKMAHIAREGEAFYKPSGAGGGDVGLLFARSQEALQAAGRQAKEAGYRPVDLQIRPEGVAVRHQERQRS